MTQLWGKDKLLRSDKVYETAKLVPPLSVSIEGRAVQVVFDSAHKSEIGSNDEWLLFYNELYAKAFHEEILKFIV